MTDDDVAMEISELPTFSLGLDFLSDEIFLNSGAEEVVDSSLDSKLVFREKQSESRQQKMGDSFRSNRNELLNDQKSIRENSASDRVNNFTKIAPRSNQLSRNYRPLISNAQKESQRNASLNIPQHPVSNPRKDIPQNTHKTSTSNASLIPSDQKCNVNNNLPLTIESKGSAHGQINKRSSLASHAKLQVVTPSCRPSFPVTKPSINPLLSVRISNLDGIFLEGLSLNLKLLYIIFSCAVIRKRQRQDRNLGGYSRDLQFASKFLFS